MMVKMINLMRRNVFSLYGNYSFLGRIHEKIVLHLRFSTLNIKPTLEERAQTLIKVFL